MLVAVVLTIVLITNIISNNNKLAREDYLATTANADSELVASYIKKGITIGGITGTLEVLDTSDATAYAEDITYGKVAYVRGERIVGTRAELISDLNPNEVYYADIEGDGIVDGVIFADLSVGKSGQWRRCMGKLYYSTRNEFKRLLYKRKKLYG